MSEYIVSKDRLIKASPKNIVEDGRAIFGSFSESIENLNLLEIHNQAKGLPDFFNAARLTIWEAFELDFPYGKLVSAVYKNMHYNGMGILVYYDKLENKIYSYRKLTGYKRASVAFNLINSESVISLKNFKLKIINDFKNKRAHVIADICSKRNGRLTMDIELTMQAPSSVAMIPLGPNKPLYSEKAFFMAQGSLSFRGNDYNIGNGAMAIIDDHKAYYPYIAHYVWLTTMGHIKHNDHDVEFGFNLTKNQSTNEEKYNENNIWVGDKFYYLPPVEFIKAKGKWLIKDKYGKVNLEFNIKRSFKMNMHALILDIKYDLSFGTLKGYLKNTNGEKFIVDGLLGIAEDKTTRL